MCICINVKNERFCSASFFPRRNMSDADSKVLGVVLLARHGDRQGMHLRALKLRLGPDSPSRLQVFTKILLPTMRPLR